MSEQPRYSAGVILTVAQTTHDNALPHADRLAKLGIHATYLGTFNAEIQAARAVPTATGKRIALRGRTVAKEDALEAAVDWGVELRLRLENRFGVASPQARLFPSADFKSARRSEAAMAQLLPSLLALATKHAAELAEMGQDEDELADGNTLLEALLEADATQETEKESGLSATRQRWASLNSLVDKTNRINRSGRHVFRAEPDKRILFRSKWPRRPGEDDDPEEGEDLDDPEAPASGEPEAAE